MNYSTIKPTDIANGPGVRVSVFVSGCTNRCEGCFNPETWDFSYGKPFTPDVVDEILDLCDRDYIRGLSVLGGDPFHPANVYGVWYLVTKFRKRFAWSKDIWIWTGYIFESIGMPFFKDYYNIFYEWDKVASLMSNAFTKTGSLLKQIDVLVDGPFIMSHKDISLKYCGSDNQRVIDMRETIKTGEITEYKEKGIDD